MRNKFFLASLGLGIGACLLAYFIFTLDWKTFVSLLGNMHVTPLFGAACFLILTSLFRALRLELLLRPHLNASTALPYTHRIFHCLHAIYIGNFGNFIFPARAGEVLRMYHTHKKLHISFMDALSMCMVDRLFDVWSLFILGAVLVGSFFSHMPSLHTAFLSLLTVTGLSVVALCCTFFWPEHIRRLLKFILCPLPKPIQIKLMDFFTKIIDSLQKVGSFKILILALFFSLCSFGMSIVMCHQLFYVFGWQLPLLAALMMKLSLSFAGSLPSAPGFLGLYQAAAVFALSAFHLPPENGVAFACVLQILSFSLYFLLGGSGFFALRKKNISS